MDPKVCGKLLTHHRRGYGVDVEALRDPIPLRQITGKGPKMGLMGTEGCGSGKVVSWLPWTFSGYKNIYIGERSRSVELRGSHEGGGTPTPWARPLVSWPPRCLSDFISKSSGLLLVQERSSRKFYSVWTPFGIPFLRNSKTRKNRNWHWALG